ncbi:MAG: DMT family transporter [Betaproteobacteria bacterium]|nr:DMT family transporter [Betaproteobacteria bacterium]
MPFRSFLLLATLAALWGGSFAFMRYAVPALGPVPLAFARVSLAAVVLLAIALARVPARDIRARWRDLLVIGTLNSALPFSLFCFAEQYVTASTAAILNATSPFFGAAAAAIWLAEPLSTNKLGGMFVGFAGVVVLVGGHLDSLSRPVVLAIAACLVASLCYGLGGVYVKRRMQGVSSMALACGSQLAAAIVLAPALPFTVVPGPITPLVAANVVALALGSTAVAYLIYFKLIADIGPSRALTVTFLIPLFGVAWGVIFLGEAVTPEMAGGGALIVAGTALALRAHPTRSAADPSICSRNSR